MGLRCRSVHGGVDIGTVRGRLAGGVGEVRRGWRNDPAWVAHYAARDAERARREIARIQSDMMEKMEVIRREQAQAQTGAYTEIGGDFLAHVFGQIPQ